MSADDQPVDVFTGAPVDVRETRLAAGADDLARGDRSSILRRDHLLLWVSGTLMLVGLAVIILGWAGASRATLVEEQVPYVVSGGLLGLALAVIGAVTLFAHWLTVLIREDRERETTRRRDQAELLSAVQQLTDALTDRGTTRRARAVPRAK